MRKLSITTAWNETVDFLKGNFGALFTVALAFIALPSVAMQALGPAQAAAGEAPEPGLWLLFFPIVIVLSIVGTLAISALALRRENVVGAAIALGFRRFLPMLGASLLLGLAALIIAVPLVLLTGIDPEKLRSPSPETAGSVLLFACLFVILFLVIAVRLLLMSPVAAAERAGPVGIIRRSWELTKGHFWKLLGFVLLLAIVLMVVAAAVGAVGGILVAIVAGKPEPGSIAALLMLLIAGLVNAAWAAVFTSMIARIYVQLAGERTTGS
jgi:hypothetical protein